jgi:hypothetical protein
MAPFAVVALDIGISGFGNPARVVQRSFGLIELPAADQQVDVTRQTSAGELKILHDIGRALEHRHGEFDRQRVGQCCQLHTQHLHAMFGISCRRPQVAEHAIRHLLETFRLRLNAVSKHAQQPGLPGETDRLVPVGKAHAVRRARIPKQPKQALQAGIGGSQANQAASLAAVDSASIARNDSTASSNLLYSRAKAGQESMTSATALNEVSPRTP